MRRAAVGSTALAGLASAASPAEAHLVTTGLGPVYDGLAHFVLSPEDLVPVVALALLAGLRGPTPARWALFVLPAAWLAGCLAGRFAAMPVGDFLPAASFVIVGGLVALDAPLPTVAIVGLTGLIGIAHGFADQASNTAGDGSWPALLGIGAGVFVGFALMAGIVLPLRSRVARTVVRVAGSWIAAAGILLVGWVLRRELALPS